MAGEEKEIRIKKGTSEPMEKEGEKERYPEDEIIEALRQEGEDGEKKMDDLYREVTGKSGASQGRKPVLNRESAKRGE